MDPLRLLTRSIKTQRKATPGRSQATPSAGPAANPQLFSETSQANRKRKRGSDVVNTKSKLDSSLDFFGGGASSGQNGESKISQVQNDSDEVVNSGDKALADEPLRDEHVMSHEACKELLGQHKVKVTLVTGQTTSPVEKRSKKKTKQSQPPTKARTQLYPTPVTDFRRLRNKYQLSRTLAQNIEEQGYSTTTEVQLAALPLMLGPAHSLIAAQTSSEILPKDVQGRTEGIPVDLLTVAPTGSGKTLAFMIPLIHAILGHHHQKKDEKSRAIVLAPTKELASQIANEGRKLAANTGIKITYVRKGMRLTESSQPQDGDDDKEDKEKDVPLVKADILVATPAALLNTLGDASQDVHGLTDFRYFVLDEADVLLDPLFRDQTLGVWNRLSNPALRVSFWSATMGSNIEELVKSTMQSRTKRLSEESSSTVVEAPLVRLVVGLKDSAVPNIDHQLIYAATEQGKLMALRQLLHPTPSTSAEKQQPVLHAPFLVFTQTIERAVALHSELQYDIPPEAGGISRIAVLHSDLSETARDRVMTRFRKGEVWILITTDLLSRGVDFRGINGVVNYDVPTSAAAYVHRVGRTGRAGREGGVALTYYTDDDVASIKTVANIISASQKLRGSTGSSASVQQWLLDALPTPSKRDKQQLKKRGIESRRTVGGKDAKSGSGKTRISTKSGYVRKMENNRRGAIQASKAQDADSASEHSFGGFDD